MPEVVNLKPADTQEEADKSPVYSVAGKLLHPHQSGHFMVEESL